jgi:hypothetical protein
LLQSFHCEFKALKRHDAQQIPRPLRIADRREVVKRSPHGQLLKRPFAGHQARDDRCAKRLELPTRRQFLAQLIHFDIRRTASRRAAHAGQQRRVAQWLAAFENSTEDVKT